MAYGLALGGGAGRGFYHLGVIKRIQEKKIPISHVAGTSIGAIVGAIYCSNPNVNVDEVLQKVSLYKILEPSWKLSGMLGTKKVSNTLREIISAHTFEELKIPLSITAVDINTGEELVFDSGELLPAVLASMSVPGVFPLTMYKGRLLCDGVLTSNVPLGLLPSDKIIVSDINMKLQEITEKTHTPKVLMNSILIMVQKSTVRDLADAKKAGKEIIYLKLRDAIAPADFRQSQLQKLVEKGYADACQKF